MPMHETFKVKDCKDSQDSKRMNLFTLTLKAKSAPLNQIFLKSSKVLDCSLDS